MAQTSPLFEFTPEEKDALRERYAAQQALLSPYACHDEDALRERQEHYLDPDVYLGRPPFVVDVEKIVHNPFYSRCADKTQVFSLVRNDDITRRSFHLQVVSRVGRTIGMALGLNLDLIEAIAVGHDLGHTPFGHEGEHLLSSIYRSRTGRYFNHNVHSVRLLRTMAHTNLCLQTYSGILSHCGEKAFLEYRPAPCDSFEQLDRIMDECYLDQSNIADLRPSTLEGCVVRISDIIAYAGKDRQDAERIHLKELGSYEESPLVGTLNHQIIYNVTRNIIKNSLGKDHIAMDEEVFAAIDAIRRENFREIYGSPFVRERIAPVGQMMELLYLRFIEDIERGDESSPIFRHHASNAFMRYDYSWELEHRPDDAVVDYIASMTDDYFVELFAHLFPDSPLNDQISYVPYFSGAQR
ncbi:MAG: deoxyguanosinetriphosphate triphosphohydrolase family protein [Coriobacteriales bacterium]